MSSSCVDIEKIAFSHVLSVSFVQILNWLQTLKFFIAKLCRSFDATHTIFSSDHGWQNFSSFSLPKQDPNSVKNVSSPKQDPSSVKNVSSPKHDPRSVQKCFETDTLFSLTITNIESAIPASRVRVLPRTVSSQLGDTLWITSLMSNRCKLLIRSIKTRHQGFGGDRTLSFA